MKLERRRYGIFILAFLVALGTLSLAALNPTQVSSLKVEVDQAVSLATDGNVNSLTVNVMVPQEDAFQTVESVDVSVPYDTVTDAYGNKMVRVVLSNPGARAGFTVKTVLDVQRKTTASVPDLPVFSQPAGLIESGDPEIIALASGTVSGSKTDFEKAASVADWVNTNIRYDLSYADVNLSAKTTLKNRAGVCDEFSALTIAMLRSLGFRASYVVGYAYGRGYTVANDFVAHGWVEACSPSGSCYQIDPTWGEAGWLDASHVKFAVLPETYYVEATASAKGAGQLGITLNSVDTKITILNSEEKPLIGTRLSLLEDKVWNGYAVTRTDLSADGCVYTKVRFGSCVGEQGKFLEEDKNETGVAFCGKKSVFMPYSIPDSLKGGTVYTCGLTSSPNGGETKTIELTLEPDKKSSETVGLGVDRTAVKPGETVTAVSPGAQIFTSNGDYGTGSLAVIAPAKDFTVYAYANGQLAEQIVSVAENRPVEVTLTSPPNVSLGETANVTVGVKNIDTRERGITIRLGNETRSTVLAPGKSASYLFAFAPAGNGRTVQAFVETDGFSTSASAPITVIVPNKNIFDQILEALAGFLDGIFGVH